MATTPIAANNIQPQISPIAKQRPCNTLFRAEAVEGGGAKWLIGPEDRTAHFGTVNAIGIVLSFEAESCHSAVNDAILADFWCIGRQSRVPRRIAPRAQ